MRALDSANWGVPRAQPHGLTISSPRTDDTTLVGSSALVRSKHPVRLHTVVLPLDDCFSYRPVSEIFAQHLATLRLRVCCSEALSQVIPGGGPSLVIKCHIAKVRSEVLAEGFFTANVGVDVRDSIRIAFFCTHNIVPSVESVRVKLLP